jgi:hypothetical protein
MKIKTVHIFGGGTVAHIANHFAITAPAYGSTAKRLAKIISFDKRFDNFNTHLELTKMAGGKLETNEDVAERIGELKSNYNTKIIFFNCALVDFMPAYLNSYKETRPSMGSGEDSLLNTEANLTLERFGKYDGRLETNQTDILEIGFVPSSKIISNIRNGRKDIFLVGFKTTCGASKQEMYEKGLRLCKEGSVNLVLVNDTKTHWNMIVTPEEAAYHETDDREQVLRNLVDMAWHRSHLTFTQSTVVDGKPVDWNDERIPNSIRTVVNYCINGNAYKPFNGSTVGHFAIKLSNNEFLTSIRKSNFNDLHKNGMVYVKTDGPDTVLAYGAKPSVGGQSQRIVFNDHVGMDCIVHFHSPFKPNHTDNIPVVSQREAECGSTQCGKNTSDNLKQFGNLKAVMLDNHGPNIVFNQNIDPQEVIDFIERNFDLTQKTGGYNLR